MKPRPKLTLALPIIALQFPYWFCVYELYTHGGQAIAMMAGGFMIVPLASMGIIGLGNLLYKWLMK